MGSYVFKLGTALKCPSWILVMNDAPICYVHYYKIGSQLFQVLSTCLPIALFLKLKLIDTLSHWLNLKVLENILSNQHLLLLCTICM